VKDDRVYLAYILECLDAIVGYANEGRSKFLTDRKTQKATLRELQELAESTQRLSSTLKDRHSELPWAAIAGFRNVLVHDYLGIGPSRVWDVHLTRPAHTAVCCRPPAGRNGYSRPDRLVLH